MNIFSFHSDMRLGMALVIFIIGLVGFNVVTGTKIFSKSNINDCAKEVQLCPDGNTAVRSGPRCEFSTCPNTHLPIYPGITEEPFEVPVEKKIETPEPREIPIGKIKKEVMCTQEALMCSDGSFVGRIGPKCEFAPCPTLKDRSNAGSSMSL